MAKQPPPPKPIYIQNNTLKNTSVILNTQQSKNKILQIKKTQMGITINDSVDKNIIPKR
ncbi:hypothetical protein [Commensalibacter melissae]|uniref:hypothetical protein n=1 Tax=Commensalibacter melissae TaxID=2070537 RepID=UPI0012D8AF7A|nr:hypothetical protein [Commensalibacter melissae]MUG77227.1 hypothetical protein [Commensalibacter melissae]